MCIRDSYCPRHAVKQLRGRGVAIIMSTINSIIEQDQQMCISLMCKIQCVRYLQIYVCKRCMAIKTM